MLLRPVFPGQAPLDRPHLDAHLEVYSHVPELKTWRLLHSRQLGHNIGGQPE